ncbi:Thyrotropin subunit beta [Varanus komodoensis]|nr:Thyrotropin subunit beta [Varanus komodoensis]
MLIQRCFVFVFVSSMKPTLFISLPLVFALTLGQSMSLCIPVEYVIHVEKRECAYCLAINTTICEGFCMTWVHSWKTLLHLFIQYLVSFWQGKEMLPKHSQRNRGLDQSDNKNNRIKYDERIKDSNGKKLLPRSALSQEVCTYKDMVYRTVMIPGCQHQAASYFSYPVAVSCRCGKCNTDYSDCVQEASRTGYCTSPQKLHSP